MDLKGKSEYPAPKPIKVESKEGNFTRKKKLATLLIPLC